MTVNCSYLSTPAEENHYSPRPLPNRSGTFTAYTNQIPCLWHPDLHTATLPSENGARHTTIIACWIPVGHASRALTTCEKKKILSDKESLTQFWGMAIHRCYPLDIPFDPHTDHQPLIPIYSCNKTGNARLKRHRLN